MKTNLLVIKLVRTRLLCYSCELPPEWCNEHLVGRPALMSAMCITNSCVRIRSAKAVFPAGKLEPRQAPTPTSRVSFDVNDELGHCPMAAAGQRLGFEDLSKTSTLQRLCFSWLHAWWGHTAAALPHGSRRSGPAAPWLGGFESCSLWCCLVARAPGTRSWSTKQSSHSRLCLGLRRTANLKPFVSGPCAGRYLRLTGPWCLGQPPRFWQRSAEAARPTCAQGACCGGDGITGSFYMVTAHRTMH